MHYGHPHSSGPLGPRGTEKLNYLFYITSQGKAKLLHIKTHTGWAICFRPFLIVFNGSKAGENIWPIL